jgi:two-component system invasion response regulator UvrY
MNIPTIRTLIVDDHAVVRSGYRRYLEQVQGFAVVAEAGTADEAYLHYRQLLPDIVIMDIMLPGTSGIDASRRILAADRGARILVLSMYAQPLFVERALEIGVLGVLTKDSAPEELCEAAQTVAAGRRYLGADVAQSVVLSKYAAGARSFDNLSAREFEICQMLLSGATVDQMAQALSLSEKTIANRLSMIRQKLEVSSDIQLVKLAAEAGILPWMRPDASVLDGA